MPLELRAPEGIYIISFPYSTSKLVFHIASTRLEMIHSLDLEHSFSTFNSCLYLLLVNNRLVMTPPTDLKSPHHPFRYKCHVLIGTSVAITYFSSIAHIASHILPRSSLNSTKLSLRAPLSPPFKGVPQRVAREERSIDVIEKQIVTRQPPKPSKENKSVEVEWISNSWLESIR